MLRTNSNIAWESHEFRDDDIRRQDKRKHDETQARNLAQNTRMLNVNAACTPRRSSPSFPRLVCIRIDARSRLSAVAALTLAAAGARGLEAEKGEKGTGGLTGAQQPPGCVVPRVKIRRDCTASHCLAAPSGRRPPDWYDGARETGGGGSGRGTRRREGEIKFGISCGTCGRTATPARPYGRKGGRPARAVARGSRENIGIGFDAPARSPLREGDGGGEKKHSRK